MKKSVWFLLFVLPILSVFMACEKDEPENTGGEARTIEINATSYTDWVYFSFEADTIVQVASPLTSDEWDIAFLRFNFATNSGRSGNAQGGVYDTKNTDFDAVTSANGATFTQDDSVKMVDYATMPPVVYYVPGNSVLTGPFATDDLTGKELGAWSYSFPQGYPIYSPTNKVFVVRTAKGKYAKVQILDYYSATAASGYVTMKYAYQADGGQDF